MGTIDVTAIILAIISFLSGLSWMLDRKKHRQEVENLKADVKQKELDLSKDYVTEWRTYIAEPLAIAFLLRASAIRKRAFMAFGLASVDDRRPLSRLGIAQASLVSPLAAPSVLASVVLVRARH